MKNPKVKHYFGKKDGSYSNTKDKTKNTHDKQFIEQIKKSIAGKLKDPAMAKKAAQILSDMIGEEQTKKQSGS